MNKGKKRVIIPVFLPHEGCPNTCVFCNQHTITGVQKTVDDIRGYIDDYLKHVDQENRDVELAFYGGSFTGLPLQRQEGLLKVAKEYKDQGIINHIRCSTRPDYLTRAHARWLKQMGMDMVELGIQSFDEEVIKRSRRGMAMDVIDTAIDALLRADLSFGIQLMVGLPGSSEESDLRSAFEAASYLPDVVRIYPTLVLANTALAYMYEQGEYQPLSMDDAVSRTAKMLKIFNEYNIDVIRIGLHASDVYSDSDQCLAGPYHPAMRQKVEGYLMLEAITENLTAVDDVTIALNMRNRSTFVGQNKENLIRLQNEFAVSKITVIEDDIIGMNELVVKDDQQQRIITF